MVSQSMRTRVQQGDALRLDFIQLLDHDSNAKLTYLARANGEDYKWGDLKKASGNSGRYAFELDGKNGHDLAGAAYDVRIYVNGAEIAKVGFGVKGKEGLDNGDPDDGDHGNGNGN